MTEAPSSRRAVLAGLAATAAGALLPWPAAAQTPPRPRAPAMTPIRNDVVGELLVYSARYEDTLMDIARTYNLGYAELVAANPGVDPWLPGLGARILLPTAHVLPDAPRQGIVVNLSDQRIYWFPGNGQPVRTFAIGIGQEGLGTPTGSTTVVRKKENPTWTPTPEKRREDPTLPAVVPAGPDNPMGAFAMYLGWPLYAIHGTNEPDAIGRRVTRGCIRLYPEGIEQLYRLVPIGTRVTVVDQEAKMGWIGDDLFVDLHPSRRDVDLLEEEGKFDPKPIPGLRDRVAKFAGPAVGRIDWATLEAAESRRDGVPVRITRSIGAASSDGPTAGQPIERVSRSSL
ncbi:L,D-transpeptidase family protein [Stella sp.]|uniref:L,D-transpeptidase family protein n=1 Tax=Stella sp. TaxID=2912054 RepID=UPI0035B4D314